MNKFLAHVYRIKVIEKQYKDEFLNSFNINDSELLKFLSSYTDTLGNCDSMLNEIKSLYNFWKKIFKESTMYQSKLALFTSGDGYWSVWISFALLFASNDYNFSEQFWKKLEKFMAVNIVNNNDENDFLSKIYEIL